MTYYGGSDLARAFRTVRTNTLAIAREIPEEQYGFRAAPGSMSVAELLAHIAASPSWQITAHRDEQKTLIGFEDFPRYMAAANGYAASLTTKAAIIAALEKDGETLAAWFESLSDADLSTVISFPAPIDPPTKTRFEMLMGLKEHEMHHRAQLMLIQRMIGQVPPLTRARQERAAARAAAPKA